jgi:predicted ester cyclase
MSCVDRAMADNGTVTLETTWEGTQSGTLRMPAGDIAPSGRRISLQAAHVFEVARQRIREAHHYFDLTSLLQQIGATG